MSQSSLITPTIVLITGHFSNSVKFRGDVEIPRQRANSAARLEIQRPYGKLCALLIDFCARRIIGYSFVVVLFLLDVFCCQLGNSREYSSCFRSRRLHL